MSLRRRGESCVQPCACESPSARDSGRRYPECLCGLFGRQTGKETQFDHARALRVQNGEVRERVVQCHDVQIGCGHERDAAAVLERDRAAGAALRG